MNILSIDSTTDRLAITISSSGKILSSASSSSGRRYMQVIMGDIETVLAEAGMVIRDVDILGINRGPGDFTGTRIGISVVKTLGWALERPVHGINSLDVWADSIARDTGGPAGKDRPDPGDSIIMPCLDVRKEELYFSLYYVRQAGSGDADPGIISCIAAGDRQYCIKRTGERHLVGSASFPGYLESRLKEIDPGKKKKVLLAGNCMKKYGKMLGELAGVNKNMVLTGSDIHPRADSLDNCVRQSVKNGISPERVDPVYVREFTPFGR